MRSYQGTGTSVEDATRKILQSIELQDYETYEVKVVREGRRGFLGMLQSADTEVELTIFDDKPKMARHLLSDLIARMGYGTPRIESDFDAENNDLQLTVTGEDAGQLIGRHGRRMKALQHLVNIFANKDRSNYMRVRVDIEDYGEYRQQQLERIADYWASRAIRTGRPVKLEPMDSYDRRIIHEFLSEDEDISTQSEGREPHRALVIIPSPAAMKRAQAEEGRRHDGGRPGPGRGREPERSVGHREPERSVGHREPGGARVEGGPRDGGRGQAPRREGGRGRGGPAGEGRGYEGRGYEGRGRDGRGRDGRGSEGRHYEGRGPEGSSHEGRGYEARESGPPRPRRDHPAGPEFHERRPAGAQAEGRRPQRYRREPQGDQPREMEPDRPREMGPDRPPPPRGRDSYRSREPDRQREPDRPRERELGTPAHADRRHDGPAPQRRGPRSGARSGH